MSNERGNIQSIDHFELLIYFAIKIIQFNFLASLGLYCGAYMAIQIQTPWSNGRLKSVNSHVFRLMEFVSNVSRVSTFPIIIIFITITILVKLVIMLVIYYRN